MSPAPNCPPRLAYALRLALALSTSVLTAACVGKVGVGVGVGSSAPGNSSGGGGAPGTAGSVGSPTDGGPQSSGGSAGSVTTGGGGAGAPGAGGAAGSGASAMGGAVLGPAAGRRLTREEYVNTVSDLLAVDLSAPADLSLLLGDEPASGGGFRNDVAGLLPSAVRTNSYEAAAIAISERVAWTGGLATYASCTSATAACREGFVRTLGRLLYRRPLNTADVANLAPLFALSGTDAAGFQAGARLVLQAMLQSPHFLYRLERLDSVDTKASPAPPTTTPARPAPTPFELATRLSYLLWQSSPSATLLDAADRGDLSSEATLAATVATMLRDPRARRGFAGYAEDWLQLYRLDVRTPNPDAGVTAALITEMKQETLRLVDRVAFTEARDLTELFTDKKTELGPALAQVYGVPAPAQGFATVDLAASPYRIGILTQPGFLILGAAPERATIVHRGLMVMRQFLCREVPPPPPDAATRINVIPENLTDRDRFAMHTSDPQCRACHQAFDQLGYPFEPFDLAGRFRSNDAGGNVLRSDGQITLDGSVQPFQNTAEFAALLARSPSVQRCLVQKMYQYALGRSLQAADSDPITTGAARFNQAGRTYVAAVNAVIASGSFRAMAPAP